MQYKIFGCKVNKYYLNLWLNYFEKNQKNSENGIIISTCVVTDRAKSKWIKEAIKELKAGKTIYITGCGSLDKGKKFSDEEFFGIYKELKEYQHKIHLLGQEPENTIIENLQNIYTKKFIVIQNGCDTHCSFCLTVAKRGPSQSVEQQKIIQEINDFEASGGKEIVLTGINLAAYGASNTRLPKTTKINELLKNIIKNTDISRIRISSLGPEFLDEDFFEIVANERFMPHFHFSIQSFSDKILKSMNRNYDNKVLDYVLTNIKRLSRNDRELISIGADIIVGFPGETSEDFAHTLEGIKRHEINKLHVFPFSAHKKYETIPSSNFPGQIEKTEIIEREKDILGIGKELREKFIQKNLGTNQKILIEEQKNGFRNGRTPNYIQISLKGNYKKGDIIDADIEKFSNPA